MANLTAPLDHPGVNVSHFYGVGVDTATAFHYTQDKAYDNQPVSIDHTSGDGTVPLASLASVGKKWATVTDFTFEEKTFSGQTHTGIVKDKAFIAQIIARLTEKEDTPVMPR